MIPAAREGKNDYSVSVNGRQVTVRNALHKPEKPYPGETEEYCFATFDCDTEAHVRITSDEDMSGTVIRPLSKHVDFKLVDEHTIEFSAKPPFQYSVEPFGRRHAIEIFGNLPESNVPAEGSPEVIYFGPGDHFPGVVSPENGQTIYFANGAVVHGAILIEGKENVTIRGRGVLYGGDWEKFKGPAFSLFHARRCRNVRVEGITLQASWCWTCVLSGCDGVTMQNVKWCGGAILNDDAIDIVNSAGVTIRDCFIRGQDDLVAVKGSLGFDDKSCENILVERCVLFCDQANVCRYGYECAAREFRNIVMRDCDVVHMSVEPRAPRHLWAHCCFFIQASRGIHIRDIVFNNIRIEDTRKDLVLLKAVSTRTHVNLMNGEGADLGAEEDEFGGSIDSVVLRDIRITGDRAGEPDQNVVHLTGLDSVHTVRNIRFENVSGAGEILVDDFAERIHMGKKSTEK